VQKPRGKFSKNFCQSSFVRRYTQRTWKINRRQQKLLRLRITFQKFQRHLFQVFRSHTVLKYVQIWLFITDIFHFTVNSKGGHANLYFSLQRAKRQFFWTYSAIANLWISQVCQSANCKSTIFLKYHKLEICRIFCCASPQIFIILRRGWKTFFKKFGFFSAFSRKKPPKIQLNFFFITN
jgi:hypothetical protein